MTNNMAKRLCLVTGASSGIGAALAHVYAEAGWDVVLAARRTDRLNALADALKAEYDAGVQVVTADLSDPKAPRMLLREIDRPIDGLVNNAGYAPGPDMLGTSWVEHLAFLQTMLAGPTELAQLLAPQMRTRGFGRILNVSSMLGLTPAAGAGSLYGPVKAYLVRYSEALHQQLKGSGVHVTALCPGFTYTDIFSSAGTEDNVKSTIPKPLWQTAEAVAHYGYEACERNKVVAVSGLANKLQVGILQLMPGPMARSVVGFLGKRATKAD